MKHFQFPVLNDAQRHQFTFQLKTTASPQHKDTLGAVPTSPCRHTVQLGDSNPRGWVRKMQGPAPIPAISYGLWMKFSGSGIPGEREPLRQPHTLQHPSFPSVSPFHVQKHPDAFVSTKLSSSFIITSTIQAYFPPQLSHLRKETQTLGIFHNSETSGRRVCTSEHPIQQINLAPGKECQHGTHKHPQRTCWNPLPRLGWETL